ncbi:bifunctional tetrahydrofolate synthase/dihydrofolate synthase [Dokdonella sp.]|uniref:bifunctional tetrahydrofolate synthase/dihydrofolate synthase n=1 Tax=Dokdonella sp. TaxID=2291710 RepID=UPI001B1F6BF6|nr:bifunctional tetrahydrofolate synthase/dihydrofolate synthase [Dokdonella sp.]MBO9662346.1 bifunctional tetrahydrofolate synthase/dihydrofolate synthase [Dokdonella sp.]
MDTVFGTLQEWLDYQQRVHPNAIELGLDRVREVWRRLGAPAPAPLVITVGGTNGKGSTVAFLEAMLAADGRRVGAYTSPHLLRYNERVRVAGRDVDDAVLIDAFERIEAARVREAAAPVALTYFEYGTLAALWIFSQSALDVAVLEVGLGGRLDAVNLIDADAAIVTTIDLDHQDWLGDDRDSIGREKAGIFRAGRPAIVGEHAPPAALVEEAERIGAELRLAGRDFTFSRQEGGWTWRCGDTELALPPPQLAAPAQLANAAAAIAALYAVRERAGWNPQAIAQGTAQARIGARLQRFAGAPELIVDVGHNPQAARVLAEWLRAEATPGRTLAVFGALGDKDVRGIVAALSDLVDVWFLAGLEGDSPRGLTVDDLRAEIGAALDTPAEWVANATVEVALFAACEQAQPGDRVLAFGSFFVAATALQFAARRLAKRSAGVA